MSRAKDRRLTVRWPTMKTIEVRPVEMPIHLLDATVDMNGKAVVEHRVGNGDPMSYHPHEAERLARALLKAAAVCRAKTAAARKVRR